MPIRYSNIAGGSGTGFNLDIGNTGNTTFVFDTEQPAGGYSVTSQLTDTTMDIYGLTASGETAGYSNTKSFKANKAFSKIVIYGASAGDLITFEYKATLSAEDSGDNDSGVAPFVSSLVPSALPNEDDSTTISGGNFATDVSVIFKGQDGTEAPAKSIVRASSKSLLVTRPDSLPLSNSPYDIIVSNPGVSNPAITNVNKLLNAITAGSAPGWLSSSSLFYNLSGFQNNIQLSASDVDGAITYSIVSGTLPAGLSLNSSTGLISGTVTDSLSDGDSRTIVFRATDEGGNFVDQTASFVANEAPQWITTQSNIPNMLTGGTYSTQLSASGGTVAPSLTYTLASGTLPGTVSVSSSGLISGSTAGATSGSTYTATFRVTDTMGAYSERTFTFTPLSLVLITSSQQVTLLASSQVLAIGGGGNANGWGGAGSGYFAYGTIPAGTYNAVIGGSGGGTTTFSTLSAAGGQAAGYNGGNGGSGGGGGCSTGWGSGGYGGANGETGGRGGSANGNDNSGGAGGTGSGLTLPTLLTAAERAPITGNSPGNGGGTYGGGGGGTLYYSSPPLGQNGRGYGGGGGGGNGVGAAGVIAILGVVA